MREAFFQTLTELAEKDTRIILLTGDIGYMVVEPFAEKFPDRFYNVGVAEQNMLGIATGLAEDGFIPFVYSIIPFAVIRPYEFIRNGPVLHNLQVRIAGVGAGFDYGHQGLTHWGLEDIGMMRLQPGMKVIAPADSEQAKNALLSTWHLPGPVYYRLEKDNKTLIPGLKGRFDIGSVFAVTEGEDLLFIAAGSIAGEVVAAAEALKDRGIRSSVLIIAGLQPAPAEALVSYLSRFPVALTVEAHYITGGLGSVVAEIIAENSLSCRLVRCGVKALTAGISGSKAYLNDKYGLSIDKLVKTALAAIQKT